MNKILIIGAGGIGCALSEIIARKAGFEIGIMDDGYVELSNLHRQLLYREKDIGKPKVEIAERELKKINKINKIIPLFEKLTEGNSYELFKEYDLICDGSDNYQTKFIINETSYNLQKPCIIAGALRFTGFLMAIIPQAKTPCFACIFDSIPEGVETCQQVGVLCCVPGATASLQAFWAFKCIYEDYKDIGGKILTIDFLKNRRYLHIIEKKENCPVCGNY